MPSYLEFTNLSKNFPFRLLENSGDILVRPHWHPEIEIIVVTEGTVFLGINNEPVKLTTNQFAIIDSGEVHYVLNSPGSERDVFQFDLNIFKDVLSPKDNTFSVKNLFNSIESYSTYWHESSRKKALEIFRIIKKEYQQQEPGYDYVIKGKLYELAALLYREAPLKTENDSKGQGESKYSVTSMKILDKLSIVFKYIENNYLYSIKLEDVADEVGYSVHYFSRFFKKYTGQTFMDFLNEYRINKAKWLLVNEDSLLISELVGKVGYYSDKTFYRQFKNNVGMSPLEFKEAMLKQ